MVHLEIPWLTKFQITYEEAGEMEELSHSFKQKFKLVKVPFQNQIRTRDKVGSRPFGYYCVEVSM